MYVLIQPKLPTHSIGRIVHKLDALISKVRQPPSISGCQVRNPLSSKAVNGVVVPAVSIKGPITKSTHVKPVPKFLYALQQKPTPLSKNSTAGCLNGFNPT